MAEQRAWKPVLPCRFEESRDGQWVKYCDHLAALQEEKERRESLERAIDHAAKDLEQRAERAGRLSTYGIDSDATAGEEMGLDKAVSILRRLPSPDTQPASGEGWQVADLIAAVDRAHEHIDADTVYELCERRLFGEEKQA